MKKQIETTQNTMKNSQDTFNVKTFCLIFLISNIVFVITSCLLIRGFDKYNNYANTETTPTFSIAAMQIRFPLSLRDDHNIVAIISVTSKVAKLHDLTMDIKDKEVNIIRVDHKGDKVMYTVVFPEITKYEAFLSATNYEGNIMKAKVTFSL